MLSLIRKSGISLVLPVGITLCLLAATVAGSIPLFDGRTPSGDFLTAAGKEGSTITIRATGDIGGEQIQVQIKGESVSTFTLSANDNMWVRPQYSDYVYTHDQKVSAKDLRVAFINDTAWKDTNVRIDYVQIDNERYQTEHDSVRSKGAWGNGANCKEGYFRTEFLACNGYFQFDRVGTSAVVTKESSATSSSTAHRDIATPGEVHKPKPTPQTTTPTTARDTKPPSTTKPAPKPTTPPTTVPPTTAPPATVPPTVPVDSDYVSNLSMITDAKVRNRNHDGSRHRDTPSAALKIDDHLGSRSDYLDRPGGNPEQAFPVPQGGQFRTSCEFSHFAYDDPIVHPNKPGAAHLHMFFGNTDVNAFSTYDTLLNSGSSTCNGQELNRSGYWAPAMFDGKGNVRIPERVVVYYKGEGLANGDSAPYPEGAAMVANENINKKSNSSGGSQGKYSFICSDQFSGASAPASNLIPNCDGSRFYKQYGVTDNPHVVLEMNVKFPQCWNGKDASNPENYSTPDSGSWYYSDCGNKTTLPNLEYFVNYRVEVGEDTSDWYLASDVNPKNFRQEVEGGSTTHADWWGAWNEDVNQIWLDNCVNFRTSSASGCGFGYLSNGGPNGDQPLPGPALKYRPQYTGPEKVQAKQLFEELCTTNRTYTKAADAAYCNPG